jgi:hypothetical protein
MSWMIHTKEQSATQTLLLPIDSDNWTVTVFSSSETTLNQSEHEQCIPFPNCGCNGLPMAHCKLRQRMPHTNSRLTVTPKQSHLHTSISNPTKQFPTEIIDIVVPLAVVRSHRTDCTTVLKPSMVKL